MNRIIQSELRTLRGVRPALPSPPPTFSQGSAEDDAMIDKLASEMESLLIDARLRAHPVIGTMWERVADEARDRVASAVSPTNQGFVATPPQQNLSFRIDKGTFTSPPASPAKAPGWNTTYPVRTYHSRATSPITPTSPTLSLPSHRPPDAESVSASESEQSETGSAVTLLELDRRSRSASPFTYVGPVRQRTVSRVTGMGSFDEVGADFVAQQAGNGDPVITAEGKSPRSSVLTLSSPPLAESSGNNSTQTLIQGDRSPVASGAKFFTSAFSKAVDI